jgi:hypothetical protein
MQLAPDDEHSLSLLMLMTHHYVHRHANAIQIVILWGVTPGTAVEWYLNGRAMLLLTHPHSLLIVHVGNNTTNSADSHTGLDGQYRSFTGLTKLTCLGII